MCYQNSQLLLRCFIFIIFFIHRVLKVASLSFHSLLIFLKGSDIGCTFVFYWQPLANFSACYSGGYCTPLKLFIEKLFCQEIIVSYKKNLPVVANPFSLLLTNGYEILFCKPH
jgi:hypothetical protein